MELRLEIPDEAMPYALLALVNLFEAKAEAAEQGRRFFRENPEYYDADKAHEATWKNNLWRSLAAQCEAQKP